MTRRTIEAFVLSEAPSLNAYFAYSNTISRDVIINCQHVPKNVDILGKWIRAVVRDHNSVCQPITIINDIFESRVMGGIPEIKVEVTHDGRLRDKFEMFHHNYFGYICDTQHVIRNIEKGALYHFWITRLHDPKIKTRWRVSLNQRSIGPNEFVNSSNQLRTVEGIVHSHTLDNNGYYAWSKSEPRSKVFINYSMCPSYKDLLGSWVEMTVDNNNRLQNPVIIIPDVYETRVRYGLTEIRVDFKNVRSSRNEPEMFYHNYFGNICDPKRIVNQVEEGAWYYGWIVFYIKQGVDTRWRFSKDQILEGPLNDEMNVPSNIDYRNNYQYSHYPEESYYETRRVPSPDIRNYYDDKFQSGYRCASRSPSPRGQNTNKHCPNVPINLPKKYDYKNQMHEHHSDTYDPKFGMKYEPQNDIFESKIQPLENNINKCPLTSSGYENHLTSDCQLTTADESSKKESKNEDPSIQYYELVLPSQLHEHSHNSKVCKSDSSRNENSEIHKDITSDSEYFTCSDEETEVCNEDQSRRSIPEDPVHQEKLSSEPLQYDVISHESSPEIVKLGNNTNDFAPPLSPCVHLANFTFPEEPSSDKVERTGREIEIKRLKLEILRMSRLIQSLTKDSSVSNQMKLFNIEEYEELMELTKENL